MADLRWALLLLGTVFVAGLGLWEWRRGGRQRKGSPPPPASEPVREEPDIQNDTEPLRREPVIGEFGETFGTLPAMDLSLPEMTPGGSMRIGIAIEEAVDVPAAARPVPLEEESAVVAPLQGSSTNAIASNASTEARVLGIDPDAPLDFPLDADLETPERMQPAQRPVPAEDTQVATDVATGPPPIRWPPGQLPDRVLGLRVCAPAGRPLSGQQVRLALFAAGLRPGPQQIFHNTDADGNVLASVANLLRPGSLVPDRMDGQEFRGLSLFTVLPGALPDEELLEGLVRLSRALAARLGAVVQDEYGQELDAERLTQLRRAIAAASRPGDGDRV
jgi:cell division protein ZipA